MISIDQAMDRRGAIERAGDDYVVRFERYLDHPLYERYGGERR